MAKFKKTHNDIKPENFVVKYNSLASFPFQIYLTDFGLAEKKGGTPVFASPECFEDSQRKRKTDVFSLGRVFLYIILDKSDFFLWLYLPVSKKLKSSLKVIIQNEPMLSLITNMTKINNRITIKTVRKHFDIIRNKSLLNLDDSVRIRINDILNGEVDNNRIRDFHLNYIDELQNLS